MVPREVELIGVAVNSSGLAGGVARAPEVLRGRGLAAALARLPGFSDAGDLPLPSAPARPQRGPSGLLAEDSLIAMIGQVRGAVLTARRGGRFPLLIGGDCPVLLGALAALQTGHQQTGHQQTGHQQTGHQRAGLLFVDGHEDAWPPHASPTGEAADCELGLALRLFDGELDPRLRGVLPRLQPQDVVAVGPRDDGELAGAGVPTLAGRLRALMRPADLVASGWEAAISAARLLPVPWWLHVDLDVLGTTDLPAVDYRQPGGLTWQQLTQITVAALATEGCEDWSVCIYNPDLDPDRTGADSIVTYVTHALVTCASMG